MVSHSTMFSSASLLIRHESVAISRARHGLFIMGNTEDLTSASDMWTSIIEQLSADDAVGQSLPLMCHHHGEIRWVDNAELFPLLSPDGTDSSPWTKTS